MKSLKISGDRQVGKSNILAESIMTHILDDGIKNNVNIVATAPTISARKALQASVTKKLNDVGVEFRSVIPMASGNGSINLNNNRSITFVVPNMKYFVGREIDYIFIDNSDMMEVGFMDFINMVMKPFVIVVETQNRSKFPKPTE
jgi:tRNA(Met) C34 N-acetyltransferase TmcA